MKTQMLIAAAMLLLSAEAHAQQKQKFKKETKRLQKLYAAYDNNIKNTHELQKKEGIPPNEFNEQDYKNTMDPATGLVNFENVIKLKNELKAGKYAPQKELSFISGGSSTSKFNQPWIERGPYSVGGRTRAIMYDPNDPAGKRVFAGGVSGGLWVNEDPSVSTNQWTPINDFWANTSISCITYDPNNSQVFYVGTGECETSDAVGSGIWKTTDGGITWTQIFTIPASYTGTIKNGNFYINSIKVRNNNGVSEIYAGVSGGSVGITFSSGSLGLYQSGLYKSTDGGATFVRNTNLMAMNTTTGNPSTAGYSIQQIEIGADNSVWLSTRSSRFSNVDSGGRIFKSADGNTFTEVYNVGVPGNRVDFALSKTNPLKAYGLLQGASSTEPVRIIKTTDGGATWVSTSDPSPVITLPNDADNGIPDNDFTRGQSFYDLIIIPDPLNDDIVYTGGIDLFKSLDGAATWTQISKWSNNNNLAGLQVPTVHADQHTIVFNPFNNYATNQMLFGNDGGIYFAPNKNSLSSTTSIAARNTRYNVTQFYGAVLNPTKNSGDEEFLAGAQDNGTQMLYGAPLANNFYTSQSYAGGDGMYPEYDDLENYQIDSYVYNNHKLYSIVNNTYVNLITTSANRSLGHFVNEIALDRNKDVFYSFRSGMTIFRTTGINTIPLSLTNTAVTVAAAQTSEQISNLKVSPYTTASTTLLVGTNQGRIFKMTDANTTSFVSTPLTTPVVGTISDMEFGSNENSIMVTVANYNTASIFYSTDGGSSWQNKEGNLPDMPVRTILMNPDDSNEVIIGTEAGLWATTDFLSASPTWAQYSAGIGNVRVTNLDYRPATRTVLVATYGRGAWTSQNSIISLATSETKQKKLMQVYPNPSRGNAHLRFDESKFKSVDITIFDASGRLVYTKNNLKSDEEFATGLSNGSYILKAENNKQVVFTSIFMVGKKQKAED
ncbi:hypothetical protein CHRYSEOSP005_26470 [Chryseobacterium sp. Alg-005]|uniref:T9SS type A sorting domain-containing protein n=1 Tax=Chryseobacterium sp. Alg-005 TaxID=3159516 RepID=UPI00355589EA